MAATPDILGHYGVKPFLPVQQAGLATLIGADDQIDQNDYSASVEVDIASADKAGTVNPSGEILAVALYSSESGSGSVQVPAGNLLIFASDPEVAAGDTAISAADLVNVLALVKIAVGDWVGDSSGKVAYKPVALAFHGRPSLYFVFQSIDATSINDSAGDDEKIEFNFWYRRDS